ncbi:hypothetical protein KKG85_02990 [Patescibacteria group bacterium]|nr:hypothetical protein [Patescibacteria group bacterium]MBU2443931.1 hypothetical protein [Nanoarchaeota archaeon]MBU2579846.1 hypothetical protein [Patescibacteria group bacterium]
MPMSDDFRERLRGILPEIIRIFKTPFILYDEKGIRNGFRKVFENFEGVIPLMTIFPHCQEAVSERFLNHGNYRRIKWREKADCRKAEKIFFRK